MPTRFGCETRDAAEIHLIVTKNNTYLSSRRGSTTKVKNKKNKNDGDVPGESHRRPLYLKCTSVLLQRRFLLLLILLMLDEIL